MFLKFILYAHSNHLLDVEKERDKAGNGLALTCAANIINCFSDRLKISKSEGFYLLSHLPA